MELTKTSEFITEQQQKLMGPQANGLDSYVLYLLSSVITQASFFQLRPRLFAFLTAAGNERSEPKGVKRLRQSL